MFKQDLKFNCIIFIIITPQQFIVWIWKVASLDCLHHRLGSRQRMGLVCVVDQPSQVSTASLRQNSQASAAVYAGTVAGGAPHKAEVVCHLSQATAACNLGTGLRPSLWYDFNYKYNISQLSTRADPATQFRGSHHLPGGLIPPRISSPPENFLKSAPQKCF